MTATDRTEWADIVDRLNASYPGQALRPETAAEWFTELAEYPAERVWRAVRRCRREQSFRPTLAELMDAMLANAHDQATEPSNLPAIEARDPDSPGVPPPPSVKLLIRNLMAKRIPDAPTQPTGRSQAEQLAALEAEMRKEAEAP